MIDPSTEIPRLSWSALAAVLTLLTAATVFWTQMVDVRSRQLKYIERRDEQHEQLSEQIQELHDRYHELCQQVAARMSEVVCN